MFPDLSGKQLGLGMLRYRHIQTNVTGVSTPPGEDERGPDMLPEDVPSLEATSLEENQ